MIRFQMKRARTRYVICIKNEDYPASLREGKLYAVAPDRLAAGVGFRRIVDESGEDYLYPEEYFVDVKLPPGKSTPTAWSS